MYTKGIINGTYGTGWMYNEETIGNPLFIPSDVDDIGVFNNRIVAHHLGISLNILGKMTNITKVTFSRNYGKRWDNRIPDDPEKNDLFNPSVNQWSFYAGFEIPAVVQNLPVSFLAEVGFDNGLLVGDQLGLLIGIKWKL